MAHTRKSAKGRARARGGTGRHHERPGVVRARAEDRPEHQHAGGGTASLRVNLTRIGSHSRFFVTGADGETIITSRLYTDPKKAKQGLIDLVMAIQADDFETFDHT